MVLRLKPGTVAWGFPYRFRITGMHLADIIKFLVAASFGFMLHMLVGCPEQACPQCEDCAKVIAEQEILRADLHFQLREPFKPKNMYEVIRYEHFNMTSISSNFDDDPQINLLGHQKADIKDIIHQAMALYNSARPEKWKMVKLINGYRRLDPLRGEEYILDGVLALEKDEKVEESHRLELVKPFNVGHLLNDHSTSEKSVIHFILPISGHSEKFDTFIANFEEVCLKQPSENIYLLIVLFVGKDSVDDPDKLKTIARTLSDKYRNSHIRIIQTRSAFNRALGLDLGARQLPSDALLFFCDVDVQFNSNALHRCRHNAQEGHQVYYPVVFAQYSPDMVLKYSPPEKVKNLMAINKHTGRYLCNGGHWNFNTMVVCCLFQATGSTTVLEWHVCTTWIIIQLVASICKSKDGEEKMWICTQSMLRVTYR